MKAFYASGLFFFFGWFLLLGQPPENAVNKESMFYTDSIYSDYLNEYRKHNIYLPKGFDPSKKYPFIYATDGEEQIEHSAIKPILDELIDKGKIRPVIYVGSHANLRSVDGLEMQGGEGMNFAVQYRLFEYVETDNQQLPPVPELKDRFKNHLGYFVDELIPAVENTLNQHAGKEDRIFYGTSNGAGFGTNLLNRRPDLIGTFICYSTLGSNVERKTWSSDTAYPDLYLQYGSQEPEAFQKEARTLKARYEECSSFCELKVFEGGHDQVKWHSEFKKTIGDLLDIE